MKKNPLLRNDWLSLKYLKLLIKIKPDFIYLIGYETKNVVFLTEMARKLFFPKSKIALFTMRGINMPLHGLEYKLRWNLTKKIFDAVFCHYPKGKQIIQQQGQYKVPVYLQTQIGVDKDIYHPDRNKRDQIRKKYNIPEDYFVFGSAIRIEDAKGVYEILEACKNIDVPFNYMLLGNGREFDSVRNYINHHGLNDKIILTDRIPAGEGVATHMNAMDCFVHVPKTTKKWVDTFPLAVVQAMAVGLPVIGSDSGAVPYQLGKDGVIIPEKDSNALAKAMKEMLVHPKRAKAIGDKLNKRVLNCFEIRHLNRCFYETMKAIINNEPEKGCFDQVKFENPVLNNK